MRILKRITVKALLVAIILCAIIFYFTKTYRENQLLKKIIERLSADSRVAEVLVSEVKSDPEGKKELHYHKILRI